MTVGDAAEPGAAAFVETPFLGVRLARLDMQEAARVIAARPFGAPFAYVVTPNAQHFVLLDRGDDQRFSAAYANAWLRLCDSKVVCALAPVLFGEHLPHAAGSDLTAYLFRSCYSSRKIISRVIGGDDELAARLRTQFRLIGSTPPQSAHGLHQQPGRRSTVVSNSFKLARRNMFFSQLGLRLRKFSRIG